MYAPLVLLCLIGAVVSQNHGHNQHVVCPNCGGPQTFPDCMLGHAHECHADEVCQVNYGGDHGTTSRCHKQDDCERHVVGNSNTCSGGGALVHHECQLCCTDGACVSTVLNRLAEHQNTGAVTNHLALHCPSKCDPNNFAACALQGEVCHDQEYCEMTEDQHGVIDGKCKAMREKDHCENSLLHHRCDANHHHCLVGCCASDDCVTTLNGAITTTTAAPPVTTTVAMTTQAPTAAPTQAATTQGGGLTCTALVGLDLSVLASVCPLMSCPTECALLAITTVATTLPPVTTTVMDSTLPPSTVPVTTPAPATTEVPTTVPAGSTTTTAAAPTTTAAAVADTTTSACVDTLTELSCADVTDVCNSALFVTYCSKFCGIC